MYKHILLVSPTVDDMELQDLKSSSLMNSHDITAASAALYMEVHG